MAAAPGLELADHVADPLHDLAVARRARAVLEVGRDLLLRLRDGPRVAAHAGGVVEREGAVDAEEQHVLPLVLVADPLRILDCSPITDGAACLVLSSVDTARALKKNGQDPALKQKNDEQQTVINMILGYPALIVNMFPNRRDDEHLVALFRRFGAWGAVGKSNFVGLRFREPIHRTLRELMLSYFEQYYNVEGEKTLRSYTRPLNLAHFDSALWMSRDETMEGIASRLSSMHRYPLLTPQMIRNLALLDRRSYSAGLQGSLAAGLYRP